MRAAGRNGIPCAFIVGKDQHIEWIGHPMSMDDALAAVVADSWDRDAAAAKYEQEQRTERAMTQAQRKLSKAFQNDDWDAALKILNDLEDRGFGGLQTGMLKARILQQAERPEELAVLRAELVESNWSDPRALNELAWMIASGPGEKNDTELKLAMRAADRGVELTDGKDASVMDTLARVHYELGDLDQAIKLQKKAVELQPIQQIREALERYESEKEAKDEASDGDDADDKSETE
jgi:tetratricopeptide (TPR) repeat protein